MKNLKSILLLIFAVVTITIFSSCSSKKDNNPVNPGNPSTSQITMTLNGDGYSNQAVTLSNGISSYSVSENYTAVLFSGKAGSDSLFFYVIFAGNQTGTKSWDDNNGVIMYKSSASANFSYLGITNGSLNVTSYEAVGGKVSGTLSGQIVEATSSNTIDITNGSFTGSRIADIP